ncbi:MAG: excinuclease ABC subunit UvrC, partial [Oscillospiraceae bacterium]|nr:excinuclease ABC subunit UvrC [Oscillospiraceae bacterium]
MSMEHVPVLREKARKLPLEPGVYIMRDSSGEIIYIGKAKALKNRVSGYFRSLEKHAPKVYKMVYYARDFDTIVTSSEFEALVLECSMIKQHRPKYNILLKDDKGYHYIKIGPGEYPRITAEKQLDSAGGGKWLGPYTSSFVVNQTVDAVNKAFMLPDCNRRFPADFGKGRPCLNFHIKQCMGLCRGRISKEQYADIIAEAESFITKGSAGTLVLMKERMEACSEALDFEKAAFYRDRISAVKRISEQHQSVVFANIEDGDVVALAQNAKDCCVALLKFRGKRLLDQQIFQLGEIESLPAARSDFLLSWYGSGRGEIPGEILIDGELEDEELVRRYLREERGKKTELRIPSRGEGLKLIKMASQNAAQQIAVKLERTGREVAALDELCRLLGLKNPPAYIEAYDISNYGEQTRVGGMVVFENGRPLKSAYRSFNIKTVEGIDDYASMREIVGRRLSRYEEEKETGQGFGRLPDLILLDGAKGHVGAVEPMVREMGFDIPVFGMVKDSAHRTRAIAENGGEIAIAKNRGAFSLVTKIQDEVHRYSITFMKKKHTKSSFELRLTKIPGIGYKRAAAILKH